MLPIAYVKLLRKIRREVSNAPKMPLFFVFGAIGGYLFLRAVGPSFISLMIGVPFLFMATLCLIGGLIACLHARPRTRYHVASAKATGLVLLGIVGLFFTQSIGGLSHAGHWEDDKENWERAFNGLPLPPEVRLIHSYCWRSPHFTYEGGYFFEFQAPEEFTKNWIESAKVEQETPESPAEVISQPKWFLPKPLKSYEMWKPKDPSDNFRLFHDTTSNGWFVSDWQL